MSNRALQMRHLLPSHREAVDFVGAMQDQEGFLQGTARGNYATTLFIEADTAEFGMIFKNPNPQPFELEELRVVLFLGCR